MSRIDELKKKASQAVKQPSTSDNTQSDVDFDAMNRYLVETCDVEETQPMIGIISGIVQLGLQEKEDARYEFTGTPEEEEEEIRKNPNTYFEDGEDGKRYKRFPQNPKKGVAITVDIPEIIVDKGQFFGDSNPAPLRICMNMNFWSKAQQEMLWCLPIWTDSRKNKNTNNIWTMPFNSTLYKMALAAKIIKKGDSFQEDRLIELLGKAFIFDVSVWGNESNGKYYLNEKVAFKTGLMKGMSVPEYDENLLFYVGFDIKNDETSIKYLTNPMIRRMEMSPEWENSKVKEQIEKIKGKKKVEDGEPQDDTPSYEPDNNQEDFDPESIPF